MRPLILFCAALALTLSSACDEVLGTGADIDGRWLYAAPNLAAAGATCSVLGVALDLESTGARFSGQTSAGSVTCRAHQDTISTTVDVEGLPVVNGELDGRNVSFQIGSVEWENQGTRRDLSITGTTSLRIDMGPPIGVLTLTGAFGAARVSGDTIP